MISYFSFSSKWATGRVAPTPMRYFLLLFFLVAAPVAHAQTTGLQLFDRIVDGEIVNNRALPGGTEVWLVRWPEARAMRLREGYEPIIAGLATAEEDELAADGQTIGRYATTRVGRRSLYVLARTPSGKLMQSYVKTGDAGWQPGYDAVSSGRVSMGIVPASVEGRIRAALAARDASNRAGESEGPGDPPPVTLPGAPEPSEPDTIAEALSIPDSLAALADSSDALIAAMPAERDQLEVELGEDETPMPWGWLLLGLVVGALIGASIAASMASRRMKRQRELFAAGPPGAPYPPADDPELY